MRALALLLCLGPALLAQAPASSAPAAAAPRMDVGKALMEAMRIKLDMKTNTNTLSLWMSPSLLEALMGAYLEQNGTGSKADIKEMAEDIRRYQVFMVQREYMDGLGDKRVQTAAEMRATAQLEGAEGSSVLPLESLPPKTRDFIGNLKHGMETGGSGQHYELLIFPAEDAKHHAIEWPSKPGRVILHLGAAKYLDAVDLTWHYPLDALSAPKTCAKCHETLSASWTFCAYCGTATAAR